MIKVFNLTQCEEWDAIVKSFKDYDVYYLSGYTKAFALHGDGEPMLFYYEDDYCRGINVVMKRDVATSCNLRGLIEPGEYFDFATPYGYGGWLIEGNFFGNLFVDYKKWCFDHNVVSEFVRFHPVLGNHIFAKDYYDVFPLGETVAIDITNKEMIWNNFSSKNRNVIRKAINNGVVIKHGCSLELMETFKTIYDKTMDKDNADDYYYFEKSFYKSIVDDFGKNSIVFYALYNDLIIAVSIILFNDKRLNYHLSGSVKEFQGLAPTNMLLWKAAEWGNEIGCKTFHLGGGVGSSEDGLLHFKKSFYRGDLLRYHIGRVIFNESIYNRLVKESGVDTNSNFFPLYRSKKVKQ